jgi:hypothetical protein
MEARSGSFKPTTAHFVRLIGHFLGDAMTTGHLVCYKTGQIESSHPPASKKLHRAANSGSVRHFRFVAVLNSPSPKKFLEKCKKSLT